MGLLSRALWGDGLRAGPGPADDFWYSPISALTASGQHITPEAAKKVSAWYRGRDILATVLAMLPLPVYRRLPNGGGAEKADGHPLYRLLHDKPNTYQDSFQWRRQAMYHLVDHGNAYSRMVARGNRVVALLPIHPSLVTPTLRPYGEIVYSVRDSQTGMVSQVFADQMLHLRGASDDGVTGQGILAQARESLGIASATERYAGTLFSQGALHGGLITVPGVLNADASKRMAQSFVTSQSRWHMPKVLEQGATYQESTLTPEDSQMLLSRKFSVDDIARWLGVPRTMLENNDPSFGNAEQFDQNFIVYGMGPWLSLFEFAIRDQLISEPDLYAEFTRDAIVRGTLTARWQAHVWAVNAGIKTVNEVRAVENLNRRDGDADELRQPANITGKSAAGSDQSPTMDDTPEAETVAPVVEAPSLDPRVRAIVRESVARVLRKEQMAVAGAARRHAGQQAKFAASVMEFYGRHAALVAQSLQVTPAVAESYCREHAREVLTDGIRACESWGEDAEIDALTSWALEVRAS